MDNFLESFPPKNANGTDEEKVKELQNEIKSILKIFNNFTRYVSISQFLRCSFKPCREINPVFCEV